MGVVVGSTTNKPPLASVTNPKLLDESIIGQIGALLGRTPGCSQRVPVGVVHVARLRVAAGSSPNVFVDNHHMTTGDKR